MGRKEELELFVEEASDRVYTNMTELMENCRDEMTDVFEKIMDDLIYEDTNERIWKMDKIEKLIEEFAEKIKEINYENKKEELI